MNKDQTSTASGLTTKEAQEKLLQFGKNEIASANNVKFAQQFLKILSDPMGLMLLGLSILYFLTGNTADGAIILAAYVPVTAVDVFLELRSEKALSALRSSLQTTAKVIRDGILQDTPTTEIVPGDVIAFEEGQSLPADGLIIEFHNLLINEASLTGESLPIEKKNQDSFYAGTNVLSGRGLGLITNTGTRTKFGKISTLLAQTETEPTPLQKKINNLVKYILYVAAILVLCLFFIEYYRETNIYRALITALTFGMAAVPEEFPLVFTLYLSFGAWRLSKHGVLVKTLPSVESLGNVDVICTDKTGTLTEGRFSLVDIVIQPDYLTESANEIALFACEPITVDAMESAITEKISGFDELKKDWSLLFDFPFESKGKYMTHVWKHKNGECILAMKGAIEGVLEHCSIDSETKNEVINTVSTLSGQGKRILGLAKKSGTFTGNREHDELNLQFVALLVFSDPIRQSARSAVQECQKAGIQIKMLTGDHPLTAHAIADELKINHTHDAIYSGPQLSNLSFKDRENAYIHGNIFARVTPEQKFEMVQTLKNAGKIVAMTGDGVNDSPALKLADIGVSMGENATDAARATAKMILMKNDFNGIVTAITEGRNIFANLRRSFSYLIAFHIPVVLISLIPPMMGWSNFFLPIHIILLELIVHPISAYAFENMKADKVINSKSIVSKKIALTAILSGILLSLLSLSPLLIKQSTTDFTSIRGQALAIVLLGNIGFVLLEVQSQITKRILAICAILLCMPLFVSNIAAISTFTHLSPLTFDDYLIALILGISASVPSFIIRKLVP